VNLLPLESGERISAAVPIKDFKTGQYVFMATRRGTVKKTSLEDFSRPRAAGIIAVDLRVDDELVGVALTSGSSDVLLFSDAGRVIRFREDDVRVMGRGATGVRGMRLVGNGPGEESVETAEEPALEANGGDEEREASDDATPLTARVIALLVADGADILTVSEYGYGKRTAIDQFPVRGRGGQGVIAQALSGKTGRLVSAVEVSDDHQIMLISDAGHLIRTQAAEVKRLGRNTQGVRIARPAEGDRLVGLDRIGPEAMDPSAEEMSPEDDVLPEQDGTSEPDVPPTES
jgi:DNA gyrase subunit A